MAATVQPTQTPAIAETEPARALVSQRPLLPPLVVQQPPPRRSVWRRLRLALILLVLALAAGGGWLAWRGQPISVSTAPAHFGPAAALVYATGFIEPQHPVSVGARVTAPVLQVLVDEGDRVRRGQPLVLLENEQQQGLVAQAAAQRRQAALDEARKLTLFGQGWVTRAARDQAVATADAARAAERSARGQLDQFVVRSGINGVVLKRDVEPGNLVTPANTLLVLGDPRRIRVTATIDERDVPLIHVGQPALMKNDAWPGRVLRGHVSELTPSGDPLQRAFRARLAFDEATAMPLGMTLEVNIVTRKTDHALLVPSAALSDGRLWLARDGRACLRPVRTGIAGPDQIEIVEGLTAGDRVILNPLASLREGKRITVAR
jgi:RND family efflux transporter MFP subunit